MKRVVCIVLMLCACSDSSSESDDVGDANVGVNNNNTDVANNSNNSDGENSNDNNNNANGNSNSNDNAPATCTGSVDPGTRCTACDVPLADPGQSRCSVSPGSNGLTLIRGDVLAAGEVFEGGSVLVDANGVITCVGCGCPAASGADEATRISCPGAAISPGLIDPLSRTLWSNQPAVEIIESRYEDNQQHRRGLDGKPELSFSSNSAAEAIALAELRQLTSGVTTIYSTTNASAGVVRDLRDDAQGLADIDIRLDVFPLGNNDGTRLDGGCAYASLPDPSSVVSRDRYMLSVANGINAFASNEFRCLSSMDGVEAIGSNTTLLSAIGLSGNDWQLVRDLNAFTLWSPRADIHTFGQTADILTIARLGLPFALATQFSPLGGSRDLLSELSCAQDYNEEFLAGGLSPYALWLSATWYPALALGVEDQVGALSVGRRADIAIFASATERYHAAVVGAQQQDVVGVFIGGEIRSGDAPVVTALRGDCETFNTCGVDRGVCAVALTGSTVDALTTAVSGAPVLFHCTVPLVEGVCSPSRVGEYSGVASANDGDGDGVEDGGDNCPGVFNPVRPLESPVQLDSDNDGTGDPCDLCPTDPANACMTVDARDLDEDGVVDWEDNCVGLANGDQADVDGDGLGDACDQCPTANPRRTPCPLTVLELKSGDYPDGFAARVQGVVTAVGPNQVSIQMLPGDPGYVGVANSAISVGATSGSLAGVSRGDRVEVSGPLNTFFGLRQLVLETVDVLSTANPIPDPELVAPSDVAAGGARAEELESALVEVRNVIVTAVDAPAFTLASELPVATTYFTVSPTPSIDDPLDRVVGILGNFMGATQIEPRDGNDIERSTAVLAGFSASMVYVPLDAVDFEPYPGLTVSLAAPVSGDSAIVLSSDSPGLFSATSPLTIDGGSTSAVVPVSGTGLGMGQLEARFNGATESTTVIVYDEDGQRSVERLSPSSLTLATTNAGSASVSLDVPGAPGGTTVALLSSAPGIVAVPPSVTIPEGDLEATFAVTPTGSAGSATLTASIGASSQSMSVLVVDFSTVLITEVFYDVGAPVNADDGYEWVKLWNAGPALDLTGFELRWGGTDYSFGSQSLSGTLPSGACLLVGGPSSTSENGTPAYDLTSNFTPDIQNSGPTADAVGLFEDVTAFFPLSVVIYGEVNSNNLVDETGSAGDVDVDDAPAGQSIRFDVGTDTWSVQPSPTPNVCP